MEKYFEYVFLAQKTVSIMKQIRCSRSDFTSRNKPVPNSKKIYFRYETC